MKKINGRKIRTYLNIIDDRVLKCCIYYIKINKLLFLQILKPQLMISASTVKRNQFLLLAPYVPNVA